MSTTVTTKGQVTIPKPVRERLGIVAGDKIDFGLSKEGEVVVKKVGGGPPRSRFAAMIGSAGPGPSTDEIMRMLRGDPDEL